MDSLGWVLVNTVETAASPRWIDDLVTHAALLNERGATALLFDTLNSGTQALDALTVLGAMSRETTLRLGALCDLGEGRAASLVARERATAGGSQESVHDAPNRPRPTTAGGPPIVTWDLTNGEMWLHHNRQGRPLSSTSINRLEDFELGVADITIVTQPVILG